MQGGAAHFSWLLPQPPLCLQSRPVSPEAPQSLQADFSFSGFPWGHLVRCLGPPHARVWFPKVWWGGMGVAREPGTTCLSPHIAFDEGERSHSQPSKAHHQPSLPPATISNQLSVANVNISPFCP